MGFKLPDGNGADETRIVLQEHPDCKIVYLTMSESDEDLLTSIRSWAKGYLLKNMSPSKLVTTLRSVQRGENALSRSLTLHLMDELSLSKEPERREDSALANLTSREMDVLHELTGGRTNKEIVSRLYISENSVKYHIHSILDKLSLPNRIAAALFANEHGITPTQIKKS